MRLSILDNTNTVVNVVEAGDGAWQPPDGLIVGADGGEIGDTWDGAQYIKPLAANPDLELSLADARVRINRTIENQYARHWQQNISYTLEDTNTHDFHANQKAIDNIAGVVLMIVAGASVPNPRPWTPAGSLAPINVTHADLIGLGAAIANRKDSMFVHKKTLEAQVAAAVDTAAVFAIEVVSGWPTS